MLSLASLLDSQAPPARNGPAPEPGAAPAGEASFSSLLNALAADGASAQHVADLSAEPVLAPAMAGMPLPLPSSTGKSLPPAAEARSAAEEEKEAAPISASEMLPAQQLGGAVALPGSVSPAQQIAAAGSDNAPPPTNEAIGTQRAAPEPKLNLELASAEGALRADKAVTVTADPIEPRFSGVGAHSRATLAATAQNASEHGDHAAREDKPAARAAEPITRAPADSLAFARRSEAQLSPAAIAQPAMSAAPYAPAASPEPLQEIAAIIDRLAAAREALAPATAALELDHAEFGTMTLRFEQHGDGQLNVNISAKEAEAQRAVAAALAAERSLSPGGDSPAPEPHQPASSRGAGGQGLDRGGTGGNPGNNRSGEGQARNEQPRDNHTPLGGRPASRGEDRHGGGIYA